MQNITLGTPIEDAVPEPEHITVNGTLIGWDNTTNQAADVELADISAVWDFLDVIIAEDSITLPDGTTPSRDGAGVNETAVVITSFTAAEEYPKKTATGLKSDGAGGFVYDDFNITEDGARLNSNGRFYLNAGDTFSADCGVDTFDGVIQLACGALKLSFCLSYTPEGADDPCGWIVDEPVTESVCDCANGYTVTGANFGGSTSNIGTPIGSLYLMTYTSYSSGAATGTITAGDITVTEKVSGNVIAHGVTQVIDDYKIHIPVTSLVTGVTVYVVEGTDSDGNYFSVEVEITNTGGRPTVAHGGVNLGKAEYSLCPSAQILPQGLYDFNSDPLSNAGFNTDLVIGANRLEVLVTTTAGNTLATLIDLNAACLP